MRRIAATALLALSACVIVSYARGAEDTAPKPIAKRTAQAATTRPFVSAFFEHSLLEIARGQARQALRQNPRDAEALFVEMEAAALGADTSAELNAAVSLVELRQNDDRTAIAAARINELAANTQEFRAVVPKIEAVLARPTAQSYLLRASLVKAAADGLPGLNQRQLTREAGILTDWRVAGPFGEYADLDFNRAFSPQQDELMGGASDGRAIELVRFDDGSFRLPEYFGSKGVYYAMAEVNGGGGFSLRAETTGTLEIFVDGESVLRHDSRFSVQPATATSTLRLKPGAHKLLVKFLGSAAPFRVAMSHELAPATNSRALAYAPEAQYVAAARKYWDGDYAGAITAFQQLNGDHDSAPAQWMLYRSWLAADKDAPEAAPLLNTILQQCPEALRAEYELASRAAAAHRTDDAIGHLQHVLERRERYLPAVELMGTLSIELHLPVRAAHEIEIQVDTHPSCDVLRRAQHFFAGYARYDRSKKIDESLAECAADSIAYANGLSESGRHAEAASAAQTFIGKHPLDREAREFMARELALAGKSTEAQSAIQELASMAPNSRRYQQLAAAAKTNALALLDSPQAVTDAKPFYAAYRRDGIDVVKAAANRHFSGGPALRILDDKVVQQNPDGTVAIYVHRITRALDRGGVEKYGEVELPHGAQVLELRTIRADGTILEPELTSAKASISMPGLLPGDAVDEEYVVRYAAGDRPDSFAFTFGSFRAPILHSRFVVLTPADSRQVIDAASGVPGMTESVKTGVHARVWEKDDIAQSVEESASAKTELLPTVRVQPALARGWEDVRDDVREIAIDAARVGPRVAALVASIHGDTEEDLAHRLFYGAKNAVKSSYLDFDSDVASAEETLAEHSGSRTSLLLAMAHAAGLHADLVLARTASSKYEANPSTETYTRPLVRFHLGSRDAVVDAETDGLAFGALPPSVARNDALLVTLPSEKRNAAVETAILKLPANREADESVARAEVTIDDKGDLKADITILLGAWRGAQMRGILAGIEPSQRGNFYQQLAARIFPGAENVTGEARNELNPDRSLEVIVHCTSPKFVNLARGSADIEQLVPTLGLKKMYVSGSSRNFPLFVDTPLFETATFRIHLPNGVTVARPASDLQLSNDFGSYSVTFHEIGPNVLEVKRSFNIPVQVVPPQKFADFAKFASQVDEAERQKIGLETAQTTASNQQSSTTSSN